MTWKNLEKPGVGHLWESGNPEFHAQFIYFHSNFVMKNVFLESQKNFPGFSRILSFRELTLTHIFQVFN